MSNKLKSFEIEDRKFCVRKFDAKTSLKISKLIIAKVLPIFDQFVPLLTGMDVNNIQTAIQDKAHGNLEELLSLDSVAKALDMISDEDLDKIIDVSLRNSFELLPAGQTQILNPNGTYNVTDVEDDAILVMRLTAEAIMWSIGGFFDGSRLSSILSPLAGMFQSNAAM